MKFKINNINKLMFKINECCMNIENTNLHNILSTLISNQASLYSKVSELENDSNFVTSSDVEESLSAYQPISGMNEYALKDDIPTDVTYIEITDGSQEIHLSKDQFYFQNDPNAFNTLNLHIEGNNASIIFNTSAEGEFQFTIDVPENFSINKPFSFESGKRYVISVDNFLILWSEVQKYE